MSQTKAPLLPLYSFFSEWQQIDAHADHQAVDSKTYMVLVDALSKGIGLLDEADLFALCRALLVKPYHDLGQFRGCFDRYFTATAQTRLKPEPDAQTPVTTTDSDSGSTPPPTAPPPPVDPTGSGSNDGPKPLTGEGTNSDPVVNTDVGNETINVSFQFAATDGHGNLTVGVPDNPDWEKEALKQPYRLNEAYLPIGTRLMQQSIRSLRLPYTWGAHFLTDLNATIDQVARRGYYDGPVEKRVYPYQVPLVLVLDQRGSMVPFHGLCTELAAALHEQQPDAPVYYVYNCPTTYLFTTPALTDPLTLWEWHEKHQHDFILIISDAGAARGYFSDERVSLTKRFLDLIRPMRVAWLNPMPRQRWAGTSAEQIARWVPMFTATDEEFVNVFRLLKGKLKTE